jgi:hypothetical protein
VNTLDTVKASRYSKVVHIVGSRTKAGTITSVCGRKFKVTAQRLENSPGFPCIICQKEL